MNKNERNRQALQAQEEALQQEIELLNRLAEEALQPGKLLAQDEALLRQSRRTDEMILSVQHLQSMLDEMDIAEEPPEK